MACRFADSSFLFMGPQQRTIRNRRFASLNSPGLCYLKWESLPQKGIKHQRCLKHLRRTKIVQAVAIPVVTSPADNAEHRKQLSESYGFKQIGEPLPENVTMKDIIDSLPKKVFEIDDVKAWKVSFNICHFLCIGDLHDLQSPMVSTASGLGMDWDCDHRVLCYRA
ncbi:hypothetical protein F0562_030348 [Nyssa sinensis]|uniref:Uncharacterized protein n=1 Tax=Nyssa sinensis TaxID=561372 RepID=A0A5J5AW58_9ASTE|nr:hypothetical protein F0562_030348 [Nyssa sinensis]